MSSPASSSRWLVWLARALVLASAIGVFISIYFFYDPHFYPFTITGISQPFSQAILAGGSLLVLAGLMWFWPGVGSVLALLWLFFRIIQDFLVLKTMPPLPLYFTLYGAFLAGSVMHLIMSVLRPKVPGTTPKAGIRLRWTARILSLVSLAGFIITFSCITRPAWLLLVLIPVILLTAAAWFWSVSGGVIMIVGSIIALVNILPMNYDTFYLMALVVPWIIFGVAGILYLISGWLRRRHPS
jgi:hypothetical protein